MPRRSLRRRRGNLVAGSCVKSNRGRPVGAHTSARSQWVVVGIAVVAVAALLHLSRYSLHTTAAERGGGARAAAGHEAAAHAAAASAARPRGTLPLAARSGSGTAVSAAEGEE